MITFIPTMHGQPNMGHDVKVTKPIGPFEDGEFLNIKIMPMTGTRYKPGKDKAGKWIDTIGVAEDRYMVFTGSGDKYAVATKPQLDEHFDEYKGK